MPLDDENDPILDACLDEVLAGRNPPDLSARIMQSVEAGELAKAGNVPQPHVLDKEMAPQPPPVLARVARTVSDQAAQSIVAFSGQAVPRATHRERSSLALLVALAAAFVGLGITVGVVMLVSSSRPDIAQQGDKGPQKAIATAIDEPARIKSRPHTTTTPQREPTDVLVAQPLSAQPNSDPSPSPAADRSLAKSPEANIPSDAVVAPTPEKRYARPSPDAQVVSFVNSDLTRTWNEAGVKPSTAATDAQWCERLFASLLGRAPSAAELKALAEDKSVNRREKLVERLLTQSELVEEYADHWSSIWTNIFIGRTGGQAGSLASREDLQRYFRGALVSNKPYDEIAKELLTATGSARPGRGDHNPAVNFLLDRLNADATFPTSRVARVLLGHQLQCAQCHEHPTRGWSQEQFWAFNSFFRQMRFERLDGGARLVNADFRARSGQPGGEVFYETPDGLMKTALPRFIDGTTIPASGELAAVDRRRELARLVVQSDEFSRAAVNRVWAQIFDYGFTRPIDDLGPNTTPTAPQTLDRLAAEFAAHDFDLKRLIRWSVLSDPFGRSSKLADLASKDMPEEGEPALFSRDYARPPQAAAVVGSLVQSARIRGSVGSKSEVEKARIDWLTQANRSAAKKGGKLAVPTTTQSLLMKAGGVIRNASGDPTGLVKKLIGSSMPFEKKVEHVFLMAIARQPTAREQKAAADVLVATKDNQAVALEDIWWALANSNESVIDR